MVEPPERNGASRWIRTSSTCGRGRCSAASYRVGFRNLHVFIHHQSENFAAGMPTDLAFRLAARQAIFEFLEIERGEGWWGRCHGQLLCRARPRGQPFNWIQVHPFMDAETQALFPIDHAGQQETSLMLAFCPEGVDASRISEEKWYSAPAAQGQPRVRQGRPGADPGGMRRALGK